MKAITGIGLLLFLNLLGFTPLKGQFYSTGEPPASVRYNVLNTPHFKLVYPSNIQHEAVKYANQMEKSLPSIMHDMNRPFRKRLPVLLHSASVNANGYVTLAPQRMELVVTPPQDLYSQDWPSQLTLHELRHFVQLNYLKQGFTRWLQIGFGEIGPGLVSAQIPKWYFEGDAVYYETLMSQSGRGRTPGFDLPLRTLLLNRNEPYSYDKSLLGSFRDFVPDHYQTGFHLVNYARTYCDSLVWTKVVGFTARYPFIVWPVSFYLKKNYGLNKAQLYYHSMDTLKELYINLKRNVISTNYISIVNRKNTIYTSYKTAIPLDNNHLAAMRSGLDDAGSIVIIMADGRVKRLTRVGYNSELKLDAHGDHILWSEFQNDPRWDQRSYSVLKTINWKNGKGKTLTHKTRYFSPEYSPDGKKIVVVEVDETLTNSITILDAENGRVLQRITSSQETLQTPSWLGLDEIVLIAVSTSGKQIKTVRLSDASWNTIIKSTRFDISQPIGAGNYVVFRSSYDGIENLYAVNRNDTSDFRQVTFSGNGAFFPALSADSSRIYFSGYTKLGFDVYSTPADSFPIKINPPRYPLLSPDFPNKAATINSNELTDTAYTQRHYNKAGHLFNIHSWMPFYTNVDDLRESPGTLNINPGLMLFSQNLLSTVISTISYNYDHGYHEFIPSITWRGWYPVISLSGQIGGPQLSIPLPPDVSPEPSTYYEVTARVYIPLLFHRGKYLTLVRPDVEYTRSSMSYYSNNSLKREIDFVHFKFYLYNQLRMAPRDIYPKWGQSLIASYTVTPSDVGIFGNIYSLQAGFYFPGIFRQHHLFIKAGWQEQQTEKYFIPINRVDFPRGYNEQVSKYITSAMFNYTLPLFYPDYAIRSLVYLKRVRANLFYDWSYGTGLTQNGSHKTDDFHSFGLELIADMHIFRIIFPFSAGLRAGYLPERKHYFSEAIFGIDLGSF